MSIFGEGQGRPRVVLGADVDGTIPAGRPAELHLNRIETYVLLEAVRSPKGVLDLDDLAGPEQARFTAARRLEDDGLVKLLAPAQYQVTRKGRDPRLLAEVALAWVRPKA